jgi:probable F420-dependent oxidoreductase
VAQLTSKYPHPIRVGIQLHPQHTTYQEYANAVRKVEEIGVDSIWNWDHFFPLFGDPQGNHFEGWTLLTAMATLTSRATIGCLVTCNTYRNPALLADMAKTVDHISQGRLILGIGAGWFERDYKEYGYEFGTAGSRLAALAEALPIIKHRWEVDVPKPVQNTIPILIGGGGEKKTLRLTAQHAQMWHGFGDAETLLHKMEVLDNWCHEVGRDPNEIERSAGTNADDSDEARDAVVAAGATHLILGMTNPFDFAAVEKLVKWRDSRR